MDFRNLLGKLNQLNESVEVVAEEADSEKQAIAARIALKHKEEGTKPKAGTASAEMMKMSKSDLEDFTKAKKGAPKKKTDESIEEATESPEQRLKALEDLYQNAIDTIKRTENIMNMTPPGDNYDYYQHEVDQLKKHAEKIKQDYQSLQKAIEDADNIRANAQENVEDFDRESFRKAFEEMVESKFKKGDKVTVDGKETEITVPDGPGPLVGVKKDGKTDMVKADKVKKKSDESVEEGKSKHPKGSKKYKDQMAAKHASMNESFEKFINNEKLSFEEAVKIVRESGGQQKIDPVDEVLWNWAQRVAANKFEESRKAEMYAGLIYERNGGVFELHDVLSED